MPQPTASQVHVNAPLTNISVAYLQAQAAAFVSDKVFPVVPVQKQTDKYFIYTKNDWFRDDAQLRGSGSESAGSGYNLSTATYSADVWSFHQDVGDQERANADTPLDLDADATRFVSQILALRREIQWATDYFATSIWDTDVVGGTDFTQWSSYSSSDPIGDVDTGKEAILSTTGFLPNTLVLGYQVFNQLKNHPDVVDRIKYTSSQTVTPQMLARMLEIQNVYVAQSIKATNDEGATAAYSLIHGKNALLCYANPNPGLRAPSAGYTFSWRGVSGGLGKDIGISKFRMQHLKSDRIEGEMAFDNKVVATDLGYFFSAAVA